MLALQFDRCGPPTEVLRLVDCPDRSLRPGELRIRMHAAPINPSDLLYIAGNYPLPAQPPCIAGFEGVGTVIESGGGFLARWRKGQRVVVLSPEGTWCQHAIAPALRVIPVPETLRDEQAATFFVNPMTALVMIERVLRLRRGQWLVQSAANSVLGKMIIRLCRSRGIHTLNLVRRSASIPELLEIGADAVLPLDAAGGEAAIPDLVRQQTKGIGAAAGIDAVGGTLASTLLESLAPRGRLLVYGLLSGQPIAFNPRLLMTQGKQIEGFWLAEWFQRHSPLTMLGLIRQVTRGILAGTLATPVAATYPLDDYSAAIAHAQQSDRAGKILFRF
ncbi:zinc-dependent alcohol dehydrogenase family protein [Tuwongella immobilis]|uniref:Enoyl reductase (ER) domain-containing protein n=1 Tax=Tuwongella immobilis TaxID=692036 RepID=A0A6C2YGX7_9BACT|nr:zinc-dependent alcohol dehydrogenase family protein [Tuwongella immobilis]VIP00746.1 zinc-binding dehydrogenase family protein : Zn-dependent oxidoreductase, NADPH:quinone reductase OS=Singulisphaera acidiphila (strain ATCC BAA-1392 / DSM 18658 / VKM B-2454 / MOB10) GN=Sinac_6319 PE=4 SV=1: ADH_N: ADH_zinc_N [Tuwongella immobilis]VTR96910.1 zinc-binding dehydrogenase family protein : Zn-dependent oxidoreductase, NADPH:quinone reductase OS=Singulisphaera acidiphila (strain ATCC BAA-1392 / DSM 1